MICTTCLRDLPETMFYPNYVERGIFICADCKRKIHQEGRTEAKTHKYVKLEGEALNKRKESTRRWREKISAEAKVSLFDEYFRYLKEEVKE